MKIWNKSGILLIATGIIHNLLGFLMGWKTLVEIANSGFFNSVNDQMDRNAIFWFLFGGFMMMLMGHFMHLYIKENHKPLPPSIGYYLLILTIAGCIIMPISGFWLVVPQALVIILSNKRNSMPVLN